jgi:hypothetical protein
MTKSQATVVRISNYLLTGMHHSTKESRKAIEKIIKESQEIYIDVGYKVTKVSGKPFKSGLQINKVKDFTINPNTGKVALLFEEDDSVVDAYICYRHLVHSDHYI